MKLFKWLGLALALLATPALAVVQSTAMRDANYSATPNDVRIVTVNTFSAARTLTLPQAGATQIGQGGQSNGYATALEFFDAANGITATNTLTITPASGDLINGSASSIVVSNTGANFWLTPINGNNWVFATSVTVSLPIPVPVADGGTNCTVASGTCLDNITGFASTGFLQRTGAGTYSFTAPAAVSFNLGNPTPTSSSTLVMMGFGSTATITPVTTGRLLIIITGDVFNVTAIADGAAFRGGYGTGSAPANGAAVSGAQCGPTSIKFVAATTAEKVPFTISCIVTGLTLNSPYWLDVALSNITGGSAAINDVNISAHEL
jgi:hypothetical protein